MDALDHRLLLLGMRDLLDPDKTLSIRSNKAFQLPVAVVFLAGFDDVLVATRKGEVASSMSENKMTGLRTLTIIAALLAGGASLASAQNGNPTGGYPSVAGGANGNPAALPAPAESVAPAPSYKARHYKRLYMSATRHKRGY
jgi:hypothetical protein